ncbi:MAG: hypothetical protein KF901_32935 [Myxococcales bacterium]|nr:hypothetical protein [Myxococcales bacterium]
MASDETTPLRFSLSQADLEGLELELPIPEGHREPPRITIRSARRLSARLHQTAGRLRVDGIASEHVGLDALRLVFGDVVLIEEGKAVLEGVSSTYEQTDTIELDLESKLVRAHRLRVELPGVTVGAKTHMSDMRVTAHGVEGSFEAESVRLEGFVATFGGMRAEAGTIEAARLRIEWGAAGFRLELHGAKAPSLSIGTATIELDAEGLDLAHVVVHERHVVVSEASLARAGLKARFAPKEDTASATIELTTNDHPEAKPKAQDGELVDWRLLDRLFGELKVDLRVDIEIPILGRRRATHRFRVPVDAGSVNFRQLEGDLSTLENALLDFAVRDGALVLERGIPLLPTRGRGKAILVWDLGEKDVALARDRHRVRLAVLPGVRLAKDAAEEAPAEPKGKPKVALRALGLEKVELALRLDPSESVYAGLLPKMAIESLAISGEIHPLTRDEPRDGHLHVEASGIEAAVRATLEGRDMHLEHIRCEEIPTAELTFAGAHVRSVEIVLERLELRGLELPP